MVRLALLLLGAVLVVTEAKTVHTVEKRELLGAWVFCRVARLHGHCQQDLYTLWRNVCC